MYARSAHWSMLQLAKANGSRVTESEIAWIKRGYVEGDYEIDVMERAIGAVLAGEPVVVLEPGAMVLPLDRAA